MSQNAKDWLVFLYIWCMLPALVNPLMLDVINARAWYINAQALQLSQVSDFFFPCVESTCTTSTSNDLP